MAPVHPRARANLAGMALPAGLQLAEPARYSDMAHLLEGCAVVITDSGGLQEESSALGVPCVTLRESTERPVTVTLGTNPLATCTNQLTVSAWVKLHALTPWSRIFDFGSGTTSFIYLAPTDGAGVHFAMVSPTGVFDLVSATQPLAADSAWHHVAVTVDAASLATIYVDGNAIASATTTVPVSDFANATDLWLGKSRFPDPYLNGSMDELRIGCRALTADEIKNLAHQ